MASTLLSFNEVIEKAISGGAAEDTKNTFSRRDAAARPQAVGDNYVMRGDRELSKGVSRSIATLQEAMDDASRAGLIVEPTFKSISGRFNEFGVSVDSYICSVDIYRKLA